MLTDSHCHLDYIEKDGILNEVLIAAKKANVCYFLSPGVSVMGFPKLILLAKSLQNVSITCGQHPTEELDHDLTVDELLNLSNDPIVVGIGETGLDYFHTNIDKETQIKRFKTHIIAAKELKKPLVIHMRNAQEDVLSILKKEGAETIGGVMHCFSENLEVAQKAIDMNFYISFSGILTFPKADIVKNVAKNIPISKILIETDSPYLAPVPYRGKTNQPSYVKYIAEYLSNLKQIEFSEIAKITTENYINLFLAN